MLTAFSKPGRFLRGNLHGHSTNSDGDLTPERHCKFYADAGYDFICVSDHFREMFDWPITDTSAFRRDGFTTLLGAELHTGALGNGEIWHFLGIGLPTDFKAPTANESGPGLAQRALDAGSFVALAHPEWYALTLDDALSMPEGIHAIEVFNATCATMGRSEGSALFDQLLNQGRKINAIAVDDVHRFQRDALGGWVMVKAETHSPEAILSALKAGDYYASTGADIHHVERSGDYLHVECTPAHGIWAIGRGAKSASVLGENITRAKLPLAPFADGFVRLLIQSADGSRAWTNPLWL